MSKRKLTYNNILNYLKNVFSNKERHDLEKQVMQDPFEAEAFEGLSELSVDALETDMQNLQLQLNDRSQKRKVLLWQRPMTIAASVLLLIGLGLILYTLNTPKESYQIVTNTEVIDGAVVTTETEDEQIDIQKEKFEVPDFSTKEDVVIAYEVEEDEEEVLVEKPLSKPKFSSKKTPIVEKEPALAVEVMEEPESEIESTIVTDVKDEVVVSPQTWLGVITNSYGEPLSGVSVIIKGSDKGVVTDFDGKYSILAPNNVKLEVASLGFETKEISFEKHETITLEEDLASLEEVVVVGYGTHKKSKVSGVNRKIESKRLPSASSVNVDKALSGKVAGVSVSSSEADSNVPINKTAISPEGSDEAFKGWVMSQLNPLVFEKEKQYNITIHFVVDENGKVTNVEVPSELKSSIKEHLKTTMLSGLNWLPAENENGTIKESKTLNLWFHF